LLPVACVPTAVIKRLAAFPYIIKLKLFKQLMLLSLTIWITYKMKIAEYADAKKVQAL
jgi:hypothetical protein